MALVKRKLSLCWNPNSELGADVIDKFKSAIATTQH